MKSLLAQTDHRESDDELHTVQSLYGDVGSFAAGVFIVIVACAITAWRTGSNFIWVICAVLAVLSVVRVRSMMLFETRSIIDPGDARYYRLLYLVLGTLHVAMVGIWSAVVFWLNTDPFSELIALSTAVGFMVGIQGRNFASPTMVRSQLIALAIPLQTGFLLKADPWYVIFAIFFGVFMISVLANSRRVGKTFLQALSTARINEELAYRDSLTGLPNRVAIQNSIISAAADQTTPFALHFIDIDQFKRVNDTLGHSAGDRLLAEAAERFTKIANGTGVVARYAGDEFIVLQTGIKSRQEAAKLAEAMIAECNKPYHLGATVPNVGCSVGIAVFPEDAHSAEHLLQSADVALYHVKHTARNSFAFYNSAMAAALSERLSLEIALREALAADSLTMVFQPIVQASDMRVVACEALVRWNDAKRGPVSPAQFLPVAEETGLINAVTDTTIRLACHAASEWPDEVAVAVNISPSQLRRPDLGDVIQRNLAKSKLRPERLEFELTENLFVDCDDTTMNHIHSLRKIGIRFSIDDFGTGYSNLGYINHLPIDKVKIDQSFLVDAENDQRKATLLRSLIHFIAELNLTAIVEGVETEEQLQLITANPSAHQLQGFVFGAPLPANGMRDLLWRAGGARIEPARSCGGVRYIR